jgi:hypothetical protein
MRKNRLLAAALALGHASGAHALAVGQVDDFENGTTLGWTDGLGLSPTPPSNSPDGGPLGAGDAFLLIRSSGILGQAGSKPTAFNVAQWAGDYTASGVARISADVRNAGAAQLNLRLQLRAANVKLFVTAAVIVPANSGWVKVTWPVDAGNLVPVDAVPGIPADALKSIAEVRLFHGPLPLPSNSAPAIAAMLGVDNIRAESGAADRDGDGIPDAADNCPFTANPTQANANGNGRGNACECGDQNGDGTVDVRDLVAINLAIFNPTQRTPLCDTNNDGLCTVTDIVGANQEIFSPGSTSICAAQPVPGP